MTVYHNHTGQLEEITEKPFKLEREMQRLFEENLDVIMQLEPVKSEFTIKNKRIDTLAFDPQAVSFVIIEYKRDRNYSVVDQGFTYLSLMLENRADFIVEYNEKFKKPLKRDEVDWSQTRVVFVSQGFTENQIQATNFKDINIELWEVKQYENNMIVVNPVKKSAAAESIKPLAQKDAKLRSVTSEIKEYTEEEHVAKASEGIAEVYQRFRSSILNLDDSIDIKALKYYVAFKKSKKNLAAIVIQQNALKMLINAPKGELDDPKGVARDVSSIGRWGTGDYEVRIKDDTNLEYIMSLVKQAL